MRILISAFACAPSGGSEGGVGWHWARALAGDGHAVTVLTDVHRRAAIEREIRARPIANLAFVFHRPAPLRRVPLNARTAQTLYSAWQYALLPCARRLHAQARFELVLHLTYGVFRHPSFLGFLDAPFVFGPVGGAEDAPWRLKRAMPAREKAKEIVRSALNAVARFNPMLNLALARTDLVLAKTPDTAAALPRHVRRRTRVLPEIGLERAADHAPVPARRDADEPFEILCAGRLIGFKAMDLALEAFALVHRHRPLARLTLVGDGPMRGWVAARVGELGLDGCVALLPHLPQPELFARYASTHALLFPSLHDSSGNVVLEALGCGVPVVCLALGGPAGIVTEESGLLIEARKASRDAVVAGLAQALTRLHDDEATRSRMAYAALRQVAGRWSWAARARAALALAVENDLVTPEQARSAETASEASGSPMPGGTGA